ncbi:hypothetical protein [Algoriphagus sp. CAU 1675]|uniref:hypothetical protein n=1 Tax=Algoriphagus sp. CAU 1675 TaxID=3032597 RepID=UPI0023DA0468|nr:hypothetical protein [Algoriphagus sp. CAU 1675]MDF2156959.1 hypothetical protein [Algoriphagus sp. CAU 1675]
MRCLGLLIFWLISHVSLGQKNVGVTFGYPQYNWSIGTDGDQVYSEASKTFALGVELEGKIGRNLKWAIETGFHKINNDLKPNREFVSISPGFKPIYIFSGTPKLKYQIPFEESRWGAFVGFGPSVSWVNGSDRSFDNSDFRIVSQETIDSEGIPTFIPYSQSPYQGTEKVSQLRFMLKPEFGLTFSASEFSSVIFRVQFGVDFGDPFLIRDFDNFQVQDGLNSSFRHSLAADYVAYQLGYKIRIK